MALVERVLALRRITLPAIFAAVLLLAGLVAIHAAAMSMGAPRLECDQCHKPAGTAEVQVIGLPEKYQPGKTYKITIKITKGPKCEAGTNCGGFAVWVSAGELKPIDDTEQIASATSATGQQIKILTHTSKGAKQREWTFEWIAPSTPQAVTFKISVVASDGDGSPGGDYFASKEFTVKPAATVKTVTTTIYETITKTKTIVTTVGEKTVSNVPLAIGVAIILFVIGAGGYLAATRR